MGQCSLGTLSYISILIRHTPEPASDQSLNNKYIRILIRHTPELTSALRR